MEKALRGRLRAEVERRVSPSAVVVVDAGNGVKGFRYELWCIARAAATRCAIAFVDVPAQSCLEWNAARPPAEAYSAAVMEDLLGRFEAPDARNRWDAPLHTFRPLASEDEPRVCVAAIAASVAAPPGRARGAAGPAAPARGAVAEQGSVAAAAGAPGAPPRELRPNLATAAAAATGPHRLGAMDRAAQDAVARLLAAQAAAGAGLPAGRVSLGSGAEVSLTAVVGAAELRRAKRGFVQAATGGLLGGGGGGGLDEGGAAARAFAEYLRQHLRGAAP